ncbi:MAG: diacylglycerol kinase [Patescibacteria group bacterium]
MGVSFRKKIQNVRPSWRAIVTLWREEFSFKIQTVCGLIVLVLSFIFQISTTEFLIVVLMIGAVLAVEALNTAIEELCDHVTLDHHPQIGKIKDLGSGAALLIGIAATIVGAVIFIPRLAVFL